MHFDVVDSGLRFYRRSWKLACKIQFFLLITQSYSCTGPFGILLGLRLGCYLNRFVRVKQLVRCPGIIIVDSLSTHATIQ